MKRKTGNLTSISAVPPLMENQKMMMNLASERLVQNKK